MKITVEALPPKAQRRLTDEEFAFCYQRVPRICFDAIVIKNQSILLVKRSIEPYKGYWALPGGGIYYKEPIQKAAQRILKAEIGLKPVYLKPLGNIEFLNEGPWRHSISMAYLVELESDSILVGDQASEFSFFPKLPQHIQPEQEFFLKKYWTIIMS